MFYNQLIWHMNSFNARDVVVGFESTGVYGEPLIHYLRDKGIKTVLVNPVHGKRIKEIRDNSPNKTDKKDPKVIADLMQLNCVLSVIVPEGDGAELRHLMHARERAIEQRNGILSQLHDIVYKIFPEFHQIFKSLQGKTAQHLLLHYTEPQDIADADIEGLATMIKSMSRGRIKRSQVEEFHKLAETSVGVREGVFAVVHEIKYLVSMLQRHDDYIKSVEKEMCAILQRIPFSKRILSIRGIGKISTAGILGETACFNNMHSAKVVEKLAGLNLFEISSGKYQGQKRISKRGRSVLRKTLYFAAINVVKHDGVFQDKYQSYLKQGKPKKQALVAITRKLIRVIFSLCYNDVNYDVAYHQNSNYSKAA
jgi:transposase